MNNHHVGNNIDHYGDGYMEQEEEWEREGLLDPAWEKQQKKVCRVPQISLYILNMLPFPLVYCTGDETPKLLLAPIKFHENGNCLLCVYD